MLLRPRQRQLQRPARRRRPFLMTCIHSAGGASVWIQILWLAEPPLLWEHPRQMDTSNMHMHVITLFNRHIAWAKRGAGRGGGRGGGYFPWNMRIVLNPMSWRCACTGSCCSRCSAAAKFLGEISQQASWARSYLDCFKEPKVRPAANTTGAHTAASKHSPGICCMPHSSLQAIAVA